ncbi:MAG: flagellar hook-basal body complex protein FliE [Bacteroidota bacterium]
MTVSELQRLRQVAPAGNDAFPRVPFGGEAEDTRFSDTLAAAIGEVDTAQKVADENVEAFIAGEQENVHEVMISMNEAKTHFQLMTEVRNRMLETYQELMRMQV